MFPRICPFVIAFAFFGFAARGGESSLYYYVNGAYKVDHVEIRDTGEHLFVDHFRVLPDGGIRGRSTVWRPIPGERGYESESAIKGNVTQIRRNGVVTVAVIKARSKLARCKFRIRNYRGQPDLVKGRGTIRLKGRTARVRIDNQRMFTGVVVI